MTEPSTHASAESPVTLDRVLIGAWGSFAVVFALIAVIDTMILVGRAGMSAGRSRPMGTQPRPRARR